MVRVLPMVLAATLLVSCGSGVPPAPRDDLGDERDATPGDTPADVVPADPAPEAPPDADHSEVSEAGDIAADDTQPPACTEALALCDDGNPCTSSDRCLEGRCVGEPIPGECTCRETLDCTVFEDGNPCHGRLACVAERCVVVPGSVPACDTSLDPPCRRTACDPATGGCTRTVLPDDTACDDADRCTTVDRCSLGACVGGAAPDCDDGNGCTADTCDPASGCVHGNLAGQCATAGCQGVLLYPAVSCVDGVCPAQVPVTCADDNACTTGDACVDGACRFGTVPLDCNDDNPCTDDGCDPATGCVRAANSAPCAPAECADGVHLAAAVCTDGACPARVATDCNSGVACLAGLCDPATGCSSYLVPGACRIEGECLLAGQSGSAGSCWICVPTVDNSGWTPLPDGAECGPGQACLQGGCLGPVITEFMAQNKDTLRDEDGDSSDWIEIYNPTVGTLSLEGWHLTDDPSKPTRWTFPAVSLGPYAYRVVFASDKDRRDPTRELHANFKLAAEGEYLSLRNPAGQVVQAFAPFPPQVQDASYGPAVRVSRSTLLTAGAAVRYHVPSGVRPPGDWTRVSFDDVGAGWSAGTTGLGFVTGTSPPPPASGDELGRPVADSEADWSVTGIQGANGWIYGSYNRDLDPDRTYASDAFEPFPRDGGGFGPNDFWTGTSWEWFGADPPATSVGMHAMRPSGQNSGAERWAIRRWEADVAGPLAIQWHVARTGTGGNGVTVTLFHRGVPVDTASIGGGDTAGVTRMLVIPGVMPGDALDLAVGPEGPDGVSDDVDDEALLDCVIWQMPDLRQDVATDVGPSMAGRVPGLFARIPFVLPGPDVPNRLTLRMKYDDGFVAWLNGRPIAVANAPQSPAWDSTALVDRSVVAATTFQPFAVPLSEGRLTVGANVLALQGLNASAVDPTFLLLPELDGRLVTYAAAESRYYGIPTPLADNDDGMAGLGPLIAQHLTPAGSVAPGQDIVVQARVLPTEAALTDVTLFYRVMFGPEIPLAMTPAAGGVYSATIPGGAATAGQMVRWYIAAGDAAGITARLPTFLDALDSEEYFGTVVADPSVVSSLPVIHWFVEDPDAANTRTGTRCSVFFVDEFYDNVRFDLHGQSTSGGSFPKKSYNVDFNSDHRFRLSPDFKRMKDINLLTNYADKSKVRNTLAYGTYRDAGTGYHLAFPIRVQRNAAFFSVADFVEDADDRWLERLGLDPEAALYKMYDGLYNPAMGEKKTRKDEDASDLGTFIQGLSGTEDGLRDFVYDNVNFPAMVDFYAATTLTGNMDCCHKNFYAYRDTNGTGEWRYLPWDVDLTFGRNWIPSVNYFYDAMNPQNPLFAAGGNKLTTILYALPEFRQMYLRRLRTLMDTLQQPPGTPAADLLFEARVDEIVARIGADGATDFDAWPKWGLVQTMEQAAQILKDEYLAPRRVFLFETLTADGSIPPAQQAPGLLFGDWEPSAGATDLAWFSLVNPGAVAVDLSGWHIQGDIDVVLPPGAVLPAEGTLYLSPNIVAFRARSAPPTGGQGLLVLGNYMGTLVSVDSLSLLDATGAPVPSPVIGNEVGP